MMNMQDNESKNTIVKEKENEINNYLKKESEFINKSEEYNLMIKNYEYYLKKSQSDVNYHLIKENEINLLSKFKEETTSQLNNVQKNFNFLEIANNNQLDSNKKLSIDLKVSRENANEFKAKNEKLNKLLNDEVEKNKENETKIRAMLLIQEEYKSLHKQLLEEKENSEDSIRKYVMELDFLRKSDKGNNSNLMQMQNINNEVKLAVNSCLSVVKIFLNKLIIKPLNNKNYSINFSQNLPRIHQEIIKLESDKSLLLGIKIFEEFIRVICIELEVF